MPPFRLYLISDEQMYPSVLENLLPQLSRLNQIGLRVCGSHHTPRTLKKLIHKIMSQVQSDHLSNCYLIDRADLAMSLGLQGVHLHENSLTCGDLHPLIRQNLSICVSTHSIEGVIRAEQEGADFVTLGPIYQTSSKAKDKASIGLSMINQASQKCKIPIFAVGGVTLDNTLDCLDAGAYGIAVSSAILGALSPLNSIQEFERKIILHSIRKSLSDA